jgi:hypothetical protein
MVLTWTKAVAIRTPVPKCLQKKKIFGGIFIQLTFLATTGKPQPPMDAKNTMTMDLLVGAKPGRWTSLTNCSDVQRKVIDSAICLASAHGFLHSRHVEQYKIRCKQSKEENTGSLTKLARSFVAGDDGRTKRRKGERERENPKRTSLENTYEENV